ncbi:protection of telomeres protein 1a isoform X2 [Ricinus communis]|uniref:protection of telomeres protein 1a isoform X2 n=1 Tax=Ricinus communis TaxID=3988 RepID=UPI0007725D66|nr:protection of telomeres protein 1a isoform X2 [Ricinus communis]|eukprot:XP_015574667.1 protection of telomeres protein 1a isoform X2 [Ricinus communis]
MQIEKYDDGGVVNAVFDKRFSSFGLFWGSYADDIFCYQTFRSFSLSWSERNDLINLRNWWPNAHLDSGTNEYLVSVKDINKGTYFDLVCQVLHVSYDVSRGVWILFVWDGTDAPLLSLDQKLKDEEKDPLPLQVESVPLGRDILCNFHHIGTVLRVMADECHENLCPQFQGIGKWVRIRNMSGKVWAGMWYGALNPSSKVRLLADNDGIVVDYKRKFKERKSERDRLPLWSPNDDLTEIEYDDEGDSIQFMTLMDVLTRKKDDDLFYCIVRVVAIHPYELKVLCSSDEGVMRLTLEDPTGRIHAYLLGEDLVKFVNGMAPDVVNGKMKELLGVAEHERRIEDGDCTRFPPFVRCCIDSAKDDDDGDMFYICRTRLKK